MICTKNDFTSRQRSLGIGFLYCYNSKTRHSRAQCVEGHTNNHRNRSDMKYSLRSRHWNMAHKSRKKGKANPQVKTRHLTDSDGWTHIIRGPSQTSERFVSNSPYEAIHSGKVEIPEGFTLERAQEKYKGCVRRWESSMCYKWLVNLFEQTILKVRTLRIDSCMVTGLGSFTKSEVTGNDSSFYQLAAFETLLRILSETHPHACVLNLIDFRATL